MAHHSPRSPLESPSAPYTPIRLNSPCTAPYSSPISPYSLPAAPSSHRPTFASVLGGCNGSGGTGSSAGGIGGGGGTVQMLAAALWRWGDTSLSQAHCPSHIPHPNPNPTAPPHGDSTGEGRAVCLGGRAGPLSLSRSLAPVLPHTSGGAVLSTRSRCAAASGSLLPGQLRLTPRSPAGRPGLPVRRFADDSRA